DHLGRDRGARVLRPGAPRPARTVRPVPAAAPGGRRLLPPGQPGAVDGALLGRGPAEVRVCEGREHHRPDLAHQLPDVELDGLMAEGTNHELLDPTQQETSDRLRIAGARPAIADRCPDVLAEDADDVIAETANRRVQPLV